MRTRTGQLLCVTLLAVGLTSGTRALIAGQPPAPDPGSDARQEQVKLYLDEFAGGTFEQSYPKIFTALNNVFNKLPGEVFAEVTGRDRPIIFVLSMTSGIARYANSTEFMMRPDDPPTFQDGFYLVILGDELEDAPSPEAIEGVLFHEIAHRYREDLRAEKFSCEMERETNRLVKSWGFEAEYKQASAVFGSKKPNDSPCSDPNKQSTGNR